ncbi:MAG: hypothetical protein J2P45_09240, partial [Candidatus Dormibacteraeota bacterium]|nr:hypothetical protein [Candidatus Dormibacteraeota bacterium]
WHDLATEIVVALVSMAAAIVIGTTASVVGRSVAFGIGAALAFYPLDNLLVILMRLLSTITNQHLWLDLTGYLLGANLSNLPAVLETDRAAQVAFAVPMVKVDPTHAWLVIGAWLLALVVLSVGLTWRRDVLQ